NCFEGANDLTLFRIYSVHKGNGDNTYPYYLDEMTYQGQGDDTEQWAEGLVSNMARDPVGGDRDQIKALAAGECDIAVVNTYYLGMMQGGDDADAREIAEQVAVFWPNQDGRGAHINISGAGVATNAPNPDNARQLIEVLVNDESRQWYAETNYEYPVRADVPVSDLLQEWGEFKQDDLPLIKLGGTIGVYGVIAAENINLQKCKGPYNFNLFVHQWPTRRRERAAQQ
ncbi:MAG: extracellular solute-binding protein, partial [bacterium]|nr:extracellular solute-binding protein [bacterium]